MSPNIVTTESVRSVLDRSIDLLNDSLKLALVGNGYVEDIDHQFIDTGGANDVVDHIVGTPQSLGGRVIGRDTSGDFSYFDANDVLFSAVTGAVVGKCVLFKDTGTPTTSKILAVFDIVDVTPNGGDIQIQFAAPSSGGVMRFQS